jgi:hypothetical protein
VRSNYAESTNAIDITTALFSTRVAWRECDLSGTGSATLTFDYEFSGFFGSGDVLIYDGSDWNPVESYSLGGNSSGSEEIDISAYLDSQSRVGFMVSGGFAVMGFDNVQVEYGDSCGGAIIP